MNKKIEWLDRTLTQCAYFYRLCLSEKDYYDTLKWLKVEPHQWGPFLSPDMHARTSTFTAGGKPIAIVSLAGWEDKTGPQIAALLVHEAVHIWQKHAVYIGSFNDHGDEEEAYAIQNIAQLLMESFVQQTTTHG